MLEKGLVQIYTGEGKGKTTAAFGLALRAAGQGHKVLIYQFLKCPDTSEKLALQSMSGFTIESLNISWDMTKSFKDNKQLANTMAAITEALGRIARTAEKKLYDLLILDEIVFCLSKGLARLEDIKKVIDKRDPAVEIILTGRGATKELIAMADLVTEMKNIKHPFDNGIKARRGIEF